MVSKRAESAPGRPHPRSLSLDLALAALVAAVAMLIFHRATHYYFSADDFDGLARARGLLPARPDLARFLPWHLFFPVFDRLFGLDPVPYHVASLLAHAAASVLVFAWIRPVAGRWSALVGALFYAAHPAHYGSVYWIAAISDPLATTFALLALLLLRRENATRWLAVPAFVAALLSKENALLVPLVAWCEPAGASSGRRQRSSAFRDPVVVTLLALSALMVAYYVLADPFATRRAGADAYRPSFGPHVAANLVTYAGWTLQFILGAMRSMSDAVEPTVLPWGIAGLALALAGALDPELRRRGGRMGAALWLVMLVPVLPLAHHTYRYYLTGPLAGSAACVAALAGRAGDLVVRRSRRRGRVSRLAAPALALLAGGLLVWNGATLIGLLEFAPFTRPGLRAEATVDRALIAGRAIAALQDARVPDGVTLRFWSPISRAAAGLPDSLEGESYWERNVRTALGDGIGVRVALPAVKRVEFVPRFIPAGDTVWYAVYREDGSLRAGPAPSLEEALGGPER